MTMFKLSQVQNNEGSTTRMKFKQEKHTWKNVKLSMLNWLHTGQVLFIFANNRWEAEAAVASQNIG